MSTAIIIPTVAVDKQRLKDTFKSIIEKTDGEYSLILVKNDWKGFAAAINHGVKQALGNGSVTDIIFLNDDLIVRERWLQQFLESGFDICGAEDGWRECGDKFGYVAFWAACIKRKVFETIGLLDEQFKIGECEYIDFCLRAIMNGFTIGQTNTPIADHKGHVTLGEFKKVLDHGEEKDFKFFQDQNREYFRRKWKGTQWERLL